MLPYLFYDAEKNHMNFRSAGEKTFHEQQLHRTRVTVIILGMATIVSLVLGFAFVQKEHARELERELAATKQALETCRNSR